MFNEKSLRILPLLLLLALAATSWWIENWVSSSAPVAKREIRHDPDYIMQGLMTTSLDQNGVLEHSMTAKQLTHFPDDDSTVIDEPFFRVFEDAQEVWNIASDRGISLGTGKEIFLEGDVNIDRIATQNQAAAHIITSNVRIFTERDYAETAEHITITDKTGTTTATGMRLYLEEEKLQLLSNVRGHYEAR